MNEIVERLGGIGAGTALVTAGYYVWIIGGYLNYYFMPLQWAFTIGGALLIMKSMASDHFLANRLFERRIGVVVGAATALIASLITAIQGWSQPGFMLIEVFLFSFAAFILVNSVSSTPAFDVEANVRIASLVGFTAISFIFSYYAYNTLQNLSFLIIFAALGALGLVGLSKRRLMPIYPLILIAMIMAFAILLMRTVPPLSTDELALESYAAHLVLNGVNPYVPGAMSSAFSHYHLSLFYITPLSTGGYVSWLSYPALSFLMLVPAIALGLQARYVLVAVTIVLFIAIYLKYRGHGWIALLPMLIALVDVNVIYYPVGSVPDVLWATFLGLSLVTLKHTKISGALYGLSIASKQIPLIVAPYLLYMLYREKGARETLAYAVTASSAFMVINAPFILLSPRAWFSAMLAPETDSLIGIGQGAGTVSFLGYYQLSGRYFTVMEIFIAIMLLALYVKEYPRYKMSFIAFPIIIFFFNYRFLFNYVIYWPIIALLVVPDSLGSAKVRGWINRNEALVAIFMLAVPLATAPAFHVQSSSSVNSVGNFENPLGLPGQITMMSANVSGMSNPQFRIFTAGSMVSVNGLLWETVNVTHGNGWSVYTIEPLVPQESLPQGTSFVLEAYSGSNQAFYSLGPAYTPSQLIKNIKLEVESGQVQGWKFVPNTQGGSASYSAVPGGIELSVNKVRQGWAASQLIQDVNLSYLKGYELAYSIFTSYYSNVSGNPDIAIGIQVDSGQYEVWYLFSNEQGTFRPNSHTTVILTNSTVINFSGAISTLKSMGWKQQPYGEIMLIVGSQYTYGNFTATFRLNQLYNPPQP